MAVAYVTNKSARTCDNTCERDRERASRAAHRTRDSHRPDSRARSRSHTSGSTPHPRRSAAAGDAHRPKVSLSEPGVQLMICAWTLGLTERRAAGTISITHQVGLSRGLEVGQRTVHRGGRRLGHQVGIRPASRTEVTPKKIVLQQQRAHEAERAPRCGVAVRLGLGGRELRQSTS